MHMEELSTTLHFHPEARHLGPYLQPLDESKTWNCGFKSFSSFEI